MVIMREQLMRLLPGFEVSQKVEPYDSSDITVISKTPGLRAHS